MRTSVSAIFVVFGLVFLGLGMSAFTVDEREHALKLRFGEIVGSDYQPGLHFKVPIYNEVLKFSNQVLTITPSPEDILTTEKKPASVDFFLKYQITDPETYYVSSQGSEFVVQQQLLQIIKAAIRTEFAKRTMQEVISLERNELMRDMMTDASALADELGITLIDVRVKRVEFSGRVSESVYKRMREERLRIAQQLRAEGNEEAVEIRATADRQSIVIRSEAYRDSQQIRGAGDAQAAAIYADAFSADPEFYSFYRSLEAYRNSLGNNGDLLVLDPNSDFFRYLNNREAN